MIDVEQKKSEAMRRLRDAGSALIDMRCAQDNPNWKHHATLGHAVYSLSNYLEAGKPAAYPAICALRELADELQLILDAPLFPGEENAKAAARIKAAYPGDGSMG